MRKTDGFTLIELMVGIICSALVTGAIITFMLMGMNTNRSVLDANKNQRNAKIIVSMVENLASEGSIAELQVDGEIEIKNNLPVDNGDRSWVLYGKDGEGKFEILSYSPTHKTIYGRNDSVLMENVNASMLSLSRAPMGGCILGFGIQTEDSFYETSVYNRVSEIDTEGIVLDENNFTIIDNTDTTDKELELGSITGSNINVNGRTAFLKTLVSQYGSAGTIISNGAESRIPYSLWYSYAANYKGYLPNWNENTPWCSIFVSWAIAQHKDKLSTEKFNIPFAAEVYDNDPTTADLWNSVQRYEKNSAAYNIVPGDLIFFDWDGKTGSAFDLEHVGVILYREGNWIYTIEGNSDNHVALRRYDLANSDVIYGYGRLHWQDETLPLNS